jgi:O-antigen/teichoic acid export membrane protein
LISGDYSKLVKQSATGSLALFVGQVISTLILAVSTIIVSGAIGSVHYGEYAKVLVPISIAQLILDPGINTGMTRFVSKYLISDDDNQQSVTISTGLIFNLSIAACGSLILYVFASPIATFFLRQSDLDNLLKIASFTVIGQAMVSITNSIFIGYMKIKLQNISLIIYSVIKGVTSSALVLIGFGLPGAIIGHVVSYLISGTFALIVILVYLRRSVGLVWPSFGKLRELLIFGVPLYVSGLIGGGLGQFTSSLMVVYVTTDQVGNYSAALTFTVLLSFMLSPIQTTLYPLFTKLQVDNGYLKHAYDNAIKYSSIVGVAGAFALISVADSIITTIYGTKYPTASSYFGLYLLTNVAIGLGSSCQGSLLNSQGKTRITLFMNILSFITGAMLSIVLIPRYAIFGLIVSTIISSYPAIFYGNYYIKKHFGFTFNWRSSVKIYVSSIVALAASYGIQMIVHLYSLFELVLGGFVFLFVLLMMVKIMRVLNDDDYQFLGKISETTGPFSKSILKLLKFYQML